MNSVQGDSGQLGLDFALAVRRIWTVGDLISAVRTEVERAYSDIYVEGEISNCSQAASGHLYFTLKENSAQMRVVMFRSQVRLLRFRPEHGLQVIARGRVTVYEARGELQLSAEFLEPKGAGALQLAFEQLKAKLGAEGLFDTARKQAIPLFPRRIGIVTSPKGAAVQDILNILRRRHESVSVVIYPAQVQGEAAPADLTAGVRFFNRTGDVDVIIVARGGGSLEDLAAFNDECLARAIADSRVPVISAVGHETDFTISDFVADMRAPTPSAAAEMVILSKQDFERQLAELGERLMRATRYQMLIRRKSLMEWAQHGAFVRMGDFINRRQQRVDDQEHRLVLAERELLRRFRLRLEAGTGRIRLQDPRHWLAELRQRLQVHSGALGASIQASLLRCRARLEQLTTHLEALSPLQVLERGYALVFDAQGELVTDAAKLVVGEEIHARVARGTIGATVKESVADEWQR